MVVSQNKHNFRKSGRPRTSRKAPSRKKIYIKKRSLKKEEKEKKQRLLFLADNVTSKSFAYNESDFKEDSLLEIDDVVQEHCISRSTSSLEEALETFDYLQEEIVEESVEVILIADKHVEEDYVQEILTQIGIPEDSLSNDEILVFPYQQADFEEEALDSSMTTENTCQITTNRSENNAEKDEPPPSPHVINGNRIVDYTYVINDLLALANDKHQKHKAHCQLKKWEIKESSSRGFKTYVTLYCANCNAHVKHKSHPVDSNTFDINQAMTFGAMTSGSGYSNMQELLAPVGIRSMCPQTYQDCQQLLIPKMIDTSQKIMKQNIEEEKRIAREKNFFFFSVTPEGIVYEVVWTTVICDGSWLQRTFPGGSYDSLAGCVIVLGYETRKPLKLVLKKKACAKCDRGGNVKEHTCYKNFDRSKSSGSMETEGTVEAFLSSWDENQILFRYYIGDGDSSALAGIHAADPYAQFNVTVKKLRCSAHSGKNGVKKIKAIANKKTKDKSFKEAHNILRYNANKLRIEIRKASKRRLINKETSYQEKLRLLSKDIMNVPYHVFGDHTACSQIGGWPCQEGIDDVDVEDEMEQDAFLDKHFEIDEDGEFFYARDVDDLNGDDETHDSDEDTGIERLQDQNESDTVDEVNYIPLLIKAGLLDEVLDVMKKWVLDVQSFLENVTTNMAESFNSLICKYNLHKAVNISQSGSYDARCHVAAIQCSTQACQSTLLTSFGKPVPDALYTMEERKVAKVERNRTYRSHKRRNDIHYRNTDKHYGPKAQNPDISDDMYDELETITLNTLEGHKINRIEIAYRTRNQSLNNEWLRLHKKILTASVYGEICRRRDTTSRIPLTKRILYPRFYNPSTAMQYGLEHEKDARQSLGTMIGKTIEITGLWIDPEIIFLGASPDGLINYPLKVLKLPPEMEKITEKYPSFKYKVVEGGTVEIKCPLRGKDMTPQQLLKTCNHLRRIYDKDEPDLYMNTNHHFYYQVQGQLHHTERSYCLFAFWTPLGMKVTFVWRDDDFWDKKMVEKLKQFYEETILPEIVDSRHCRQMEIREKMLKPIKRRNEVFLQKEENNILEMQEDLKDKETNNNFLDIATSSIHDKDNDAIKIEENLKKTGNSDELLHIQENRHDTVKIKEHLNKRKSTDELTALLKENHCTVEIKKTLCKRKSCDDVIYMGTVPKKVQTSDNDDFIRHSLLAIACGKTEDILQRVLRVNYKLNDQDLDTYLELLAQCNPALEILSVLSLSAARNQKECTKSVDVQVIGGSESDHWHCYHFNEQGLVIFESLYDLNYEKLFDSEKQYIFNRYPKLSTANIQFKKVANQPDQFSCGVYAAAIATSIVFGKDPSGQSYSENASEMRKHFVDVIASQKVSLFPCKAKKVYMGNVQKKVKTSDDDDDLIRYSLPAVACGKTEDILQRVLTANYKLQDEDLNTYLELLAQCNPALEILSVLSLSAARYQKECTKSVDVQVIGGCGSDHWHCYHFHGQGLVIFESLHDDLNYAKLPDSEKQYIFNRYPKVSPANIQFKKVASQPDEFSCGVYAAAIATSIVFGKDPSGQSYSENASEMRKHFVDVIASQKVSLFPCKAKTVYMGTVQKKVKTSDDDDDSIRYSLPAIACGKTEDILQRVLIANYKLQDEDLNTYIELLAQCNPAFEILSVLSLSAARYQKECTKSVDVQVIGGCGSDHWHCYHFHGQGLVIFESLHDDLNYAKLPDSEKQYIFNRYPKVSPANIQFKKVASQPDEFSCGVYAAAIATSIVFGKDPSGQSYSENASEMRKHFVNIIASQKKCGDALYKIREVKANGSYIFKVIKLLPKGENLTYHQLQQFLYCERSVTSPLRREVDRGGGDLRQIQRVRECIELLHKRNNINSRRSGRSKSSGSGSLVQVSAGELLGRTHEELVLLLIQLRRQSATLCKAMENCHMEIETQARLVELDSPSRLENLQKQEKLEKHLMDLEKEYEKGKPLENLVANMLKLGSLYNRSAANGSVSGSRHDLLQENTREYRDRLEFNQRVEEQRLLAQERRDWDRLSPDHGQLQAKVQQLFKTDRLLQEESATVHSLQQDKEILQKALDSLRYKLQGTRSSPAEVEHYRLLERELSKVRMLLAHHSKKLEETVAENDRLEQDLVVLRQKLQPSRRYVGSIPRDSTGTTAAWEAELAQQHVSDLKRQRQELSNQIRQLKEQIRPQTSTTPQVHHSKKRTLSSWLETDLDSGITRDHGLDNSSSSPSLSSSPHGRPIESPHQHLSQSSPPYKEPSIYYKENSYRHSPPRQAHQNQQHSPQNHITTLSPQLREQIHQHQLKQQLLKDQIQGKSSPIQNNIPLYVNTEIRKQDDKHYDSPNKEPVPPPEYIPPPPPPPPSEDALLLNGNYGHDDNKFSGLIHGKEKQEIKTVRIVKRESERRQRDRGDRTGGLGIPLMNGLSAPGGAKRLGEEESGGSQHFEKAQLGKVIEETPIAHAQSTVQLSEIDDVQFQRSMSLPRGFGGQRPHPAVHQAPVLPPPRSDSMNALKNMIARRHRVRFENQDGSSDSTLSPYTDSPSSSSYVPMSSPNYSMSPPYSPSQQNYQVQSIRSQQQPVQYYSQYGSTPSIKAESLAGVLSPGPMSPTVLSVHERLFGSAASLSSLTESPPQLSPIFKSEAAKQIIKEMTEKKVEGPRRRQVPKEKRRHYTVSSCKPIFDLEDTITKMGMGRARDDLDMERALRPRINAPDVVRSTLSQKELKYNESTIDQLLGTPNKIVIPERYIPEKTPELTAEEREQRLKKAESIRKMLSETVVTASEGGEDEKNTEKSGTLKQKVEEEKRQREHILQLNQILAKQVMEKSKMVAVKALATLPLDQTLRFEDDDLSPITPLPLYQQRDNFYS